MRIRPILFNTEMVQAVLDDKKTTTRRIAKCIYPYSEYDDFTTIIKGEFTGPVSEENIIKLKSPYQIGDILYVRETWSMRRSNACIGSTTGRCPYDSCETASDPCFEDEYIYKATDSLDSSIEKWHPSIHMPKSAARIFLEVTDIRIERLQNMSLDDFLDEGISIRYEAFNDPENAYMEAKKIFMSIWDSTICKKDIGKYGWDANPYVWVISFEQTSRPDTPNQQKGRSKNVNS